MNKFKLAFMAAAILTAVGGAFATKPCVQCELSQQYTWNGSVYVPVSGQWGIDYDCAGTAGWCTYYRPDPINQPNYYLGCRVGIFTPIN